MQLTLQQQLKIAETFRAWPLNDVVFVPELDGQFERRAYPHLLAPTNAEVEKNLEEQKKIEQQEQKAEELEMAKATTMSDARKRHYEIFPGPANAARGKKEAILKYVESLALSEETDIGDWKLDLFRDKEKNIIQDRVKINRIFFRELKKRKKESPVIPEADPELLLKLSLHFKDNMKQRIEGANNNINYYTGRLEDQKRNLIKTERHVSDHKAELEKLLEEQKNQTSNNQYVEQIKKLLATGNYTIAEKQQTGALCFLTKPINKTFFDEKQATNLMVPLGQFIVELWTYGTENWEVHVYAGKDNISPIKGRKELIHPHAGNTGHGAICFGSMRPAYLQAVKAQNVYDTMMVVWDVLANFQESDGYVELYKFEDAYKAKLKKEAKNVAKV